MDHRFLKKRFTLHQSPEVAAAAKRTEARTGNAVPESNADARIQNYLDRLRQIFDREDPEYRAQGIAAFKEVMYQRFIIQPENIPDALLTDRQIDSDRRKGIEGGGSIVVTDEVRKAVSGPIIEDQKQSLDLWIDYAATRNAVYPDWLKYWALRSIIAMGEYNKDKREFSKRSKSTTQPFPSLNREALALVLEAVNKKYSQQKFETKRLNEDGNTELSRLLSVENFSALYAFALQEVGSMEDVDLTVTDGEWVKYDKLASATASEGSDDIGTYNLLDLPEDQRAQVIQLAKSIKGYGTGWCTATPATAASQLWDGDFYVYYSMSSDGQPKIPRAAIFTHGNSDTIGELRGISYEQELDPYMGHVVAEKMRDFGQEGKRYQKQAVNHQRLYAIEAKLAASENLSKEDLVFLYEIDSEIEGFGYVKNPLIAQLLEKRDVQTDMCIIFECRSEEIAHTQEEVNMNTKAYVGQLYPGIFSDLKSIEHIYTTFPKNKIRRIELEVPRLSRTELIEAGDQDAMDHIDSRRRSIPHDVKGLLRRHSHKIETSLSSNQDRANPLRFISLTVGDLGFSGGCTTEEFFQRAGEFGLIACPAYAGLQYHIECADQPRNEVVTIAMDPMQGHPPSLVGDYLFFITNSYTDAELRVQKTAKDFMVYANQSFLFCLQDQG